MPGCVDSPLARRWVRRISSNRLENRRHFKDILRLPTSHSLSTHPSILVLFTKWPYLLHPFQLHWCTYIFHIQQSTSTKQIIHTICMACLLCNLHPLKWVNNTWEQFVTLEKPVTAVNHTMITWQRLTAWYNSLHAYHTFDYSSIIIRAHLP